MTDELNFQWDEHHRNDPSDLLALHIAAEQGFDGPMRLISDGPGVDGNFKDEDGQTPLSKAAEHGREDMVRLLLGREDVDADSQDDRKQTPLSRAAQNG
jgi:ankyrin repeat protein